MDYNIYTSNAVDFNPEDISSELPSLESMEGLFGQNSSGVFELLNNEAEILAPFNINYFKHNNLIYIQLINISGVDYCTSITQFCSPIPSNENLLPNSIYDACNFAFENRKEHAEFMIKLVVDAVGVLLFEKELEDTYECGEKARGLYEQERQRRIVNNSKNIPTIT